MSRMMKGCQRKMVIVPGKDKEIFETAYFVLRKESEKCVLRHRDLLEEANRIINAQQLRAERDRDLRRRKWLGWALWFFGVLVGAGIGILLSLLFRPY